MSNMNTDFLLNERHIISESAFVELAVRPVPSPHSVGRPLFEYRLSLFVKGKCVLCHGSEAVEGDPEPTGKGLVSCVFTSPEALLSHFWNDVDQWRT